MTQPPVTSQEAPLDPNDPETQAALIRASEVPAGSDVLEHLSTEDWSADASGDNVCAGDATSAPSSQELAEAAELLLNSQEFKQIGSYPVLRATEALMVAEPQPTQGDALACIRTALRAVLEANLLRHSRADTPIEEKTEHMNLYLLTHTNENNYNMDLVIQETSPETAADAWCAYWSEQEVIDDTYCDGPLVKSLPKDSDAPVLRVFQIEAKPGVAGVLSWYQADPAGCCKLCGHVNP